MSAKAALKAIRNKLQDNEPEGALYEATNLLKSLSDDAPEAPTALSYRALALTYLERFDEAEKSYLHALRLAPSHPLASPGLKKFYIKHERWESLGKMLEQNVQATYDARDGDKLQSAMQELLDLYVEHGPEPKVWETLQLLVPSSPAVPLIQSAAVPEGGYVPLAAPTYPGNNKTAPALPKPLPHVHYLAGSLEVTLYLLLRVQNQIQSTVEAKVKVARQRIGAVSEHHERSKVNGEVLGGSLGQQMINLLRDVASHPNVSEDVRRVVEMEEFDHWRKLVAPSRSEKHAKADPKKADAKLPPKPKVDSPPPKDDVLPLFRAPSADRPSKEECLKRANDLADGFILLDIGGAAEEAWNWRLNGRDEPTIFYDHELLLKYAKTFPKAALTDFIDDYCRLFRLPLPAPEEEVAADSTAAKSDDSEKKVKYRRPKKNKGPNARERRRLRRLANREGELPEDVDEEEREELISSMTKLLKSGGLHKNVWVHRVMARVAITDEDWANAIAYAESGRKLVRDLEGQRGVKLSAVQTSLDAALGVALVPYYPPKHHQRAQRLLTTVLQSEPNDYESHFALGQILQTAGKWEKARAEFQTLLDLGGDEKQMVSAREELGWCLVNEGKLEEGRDVLEHVVEVRDTRKEQDNKDDEKRPRARAWWRLGRTEWMIDTPESRKQAEDWFMASLRADDSYAASYTSLGICYDEQSPPDHERALRCFQKAFELDATETEAAKRLAFGYADEDEWALVRAIATRVMEGEGGVEGVAGGQVMNPAGRFAPKNGWAWKALGSTEMYYRKYPQAVDAYNIALRAQPEDASMWRMLGWAYVKCGRHIAGLKALNRALELDPTSWMAHYHIGEVYMQLGQYVQAIEAFSAVDEQVGGGEIGVTAMLADATLSLGLQTAAQGFHERSRRSFHEAIGYAHAVVKTGAHRAWAWKLIGDAALKLAETEVTESDITSNAAVLHPVLETLDKDDGDRRSAVQNLGHARNLLQSPPSNGYTAKAAVFFFAYRAHLLKNEHVADAALSDLACALHALALRAEGEEKTAATTAAVAAVRLALERDASDERLWNALGVLCSEAGKQLAQHAFVVSLECYGKDPAVWTNLGYLYLELDDRELANEAFLKAQTLDPDYARAWFGQATLAERDGQHDTAANLFAHAYTLSNGSLLEADLALALSAFAPFLRGPRDTGALHQPAFALKRYVAARPSSATAQHLYALVLERLGMPEQAVAALEKATSLLEAEFEAAETAELEADYTIALANLGRVRLAAGQYAGALEACTNFLELAAGSQDARVVRLLPQARLGSALAHFWLGGVDACLEAFQGALEDAKNDPALSAEVTVLLARTLWAVGDDDAREAAKTHLLECLEQENPSVKVIATLGAAGLTSDDTDLLDAAVAELAGVSADRRAAQDPAGLADVVLFAHALVQGDSEKALAVLENAAASAPHSAAQRNRLALAYIAAGKVDAATPLLQTTGPLSRGGSVEERAESDRERGVALTLEGEDGAPDLQRAALLAPWEAKNWEAVAWAKRAMAEVDAAE